MIFAGGVSYSVLQVVQRHHTSGTAINNHSINQSIMQLMTRHVSLKK